MRAQPRRKKTSSHSALSVVCFRGDEMVSVALNRYPKGNCCCRKALQERIYRIMAHHLINRKFYEAIISFDENEESQEYYYKIMNTKTGRINSAGREETVREQILRVYAMLFCEDLGASAGTIAGPDEVEATADRLYVGELGFDPEHWYRMQHHFPVIDDDNYDRFAALVIADLSAGPLREAVINGEDMLLVGGPNPLSMTKEQRENQQPRPVALGEEAVI